VTKVNQDIDRKLCHSQEINIVQTASDRAATPGKVFPKKTK
jgi:hypothetical protein